MGRERKGSKRWVGERRRERMKRRGERRERREREGDGREGGRERH